MDKRITESMGRFVTSPNVPIGNYGCASSSIRPPTFSSCARAFPDPAGVGFLDAVPETINVLLSIVHRHMLQDTALFFKCGLSRKKEYLKWQ
jgi:hypothetical protein